MATSLASHIDTPEHVHEIRRVLGKKPFLRQLYMESYQKFRTLVDATPVGGAVLELGSGGGFIKEIIPDAVTSDTLAYPQVDQVVDATAMPFADGSLRAVFLMNVFHHIANAPRFFAELDRCLKPGGTVFIADQHRGWISEPILKYVHHEPYDAAATRWEFETTGPLSGANGALAWIVFRRDRNQFEKLYPRLEVVSYRTHTPLRYWLSGGLKEWSLAPAWAFMPATHIDNALARLAPDLGSFADIILRKKP